VRRSPLAVLVLLACSTHGASGDPASAQAACDAAFDVYAAGRCTAVPPDAELERVRLRFRQSCTARVALEGTSLTAAQVRACAEATTALPCGAVERPAACITAPGALPPGASCADDAQCASTRCERTFGVSASGAAPVVPSCGTCAAAGRAGEPCGDGALLDACVDGAACAAVAGRLVCAAVTYGAAGDPCDGAARPCGTGAACDPASGRCVASAPAAPPAPPRAWARAGQACGAAVACEVGACAGAGAGPVTVCPRVLDDGAACVAFDAAATCDAFAACTDRTCAIEYTAPCR
jgi:hypothetical protein